MPRRWEQYEENLVLVLATPLVQLIFIILMKQKISILLLLTFLYQCINILHVHYTNFLAPHPQRQETPRQPIEPRSSAS